MAKKLLLAFIVSAILFSACKKESEKLNTTALSEYAPLDTGKYIIYQLDSFRYLPFSTQSIIISYQVKFLVDAAITDNLGRPAYRIIRSIRKTSADAWQIDNSFTAINTGNIYEFIDENMRFVKLQEPVKNGYSWKGNSYINTNSQFSDYSFLNNWDYIYDSVDAPLSLGAINLDSTIKVAQQDEIIGNPEDVNSYSEKNYSTEYYAKGIGLVYKRFLHSEYQPPTTSGGSGYYSDATKGLTLTMIGHN